MRLKRLASLSIALLFLLGVLFLTSSCIPFLAGAAGGAIAGGDDNERAERYVATHDVTPRIAKAMYDGRVVQGMTKEQVRVTMKDELITCEVSAVESARTRWDCLNEDPKFIGGYIVYFKDGRVVDYDDPAE